MNHLNLDAIAEAHRREIIREVREIRRDEQPAVRPAGGAGWYETSMYGLANWMIDTGKSLRRRYEVPVTGCAHAQTKSYAR